MPLFWTEILDISIDEIFVYFDFIYFKDFENFVFFFT